MPSIFSKIGKAANDLLNKGYEKAGHKVTAKSSTKSGLNFSSEIQHDASKKSVSSKLGVKYNCKETGMQVDKFEVDQSGKLTAKIYANDVVDNTRLVLDTELTPMSGTKSEKVELGVEYVKDNVAGTVTISPMDPTTVGLSLNLAHEKFTFGAGMNSEDLMPPKKEGDEEKAVNILDRFKGFGATVGYNDTDLTANLHYRYGKANRGAKSKTHNMEFNYLHQYDADTQLVTVLNFDDVVTTGAHSHNLVFGGKYKVDSDSHLQAKVNASKKTTDLSYSVKLRPTVTMVASTSFSIDVNNSNFGDAKLGLGFSFGH